MSGAGPDEFDGASDGAEDAAEAAGEYAERVARGRRFAEFVGSVRVLVRMLREYRRGDFALSWQEVTVLLASLAYVVAPVDAVPEAVLGPAGLADDVAAVAGAVAVLADALARFARRGPAVEG